MELKSLVLRPLEKLRREGNVDEAVTARPDDEVASALLFLQNRRGVCCRAHVRSHALCAARTFALHYAPHSPSSTETDLDPVKRYLQKGVADPVYSKERR